MLSKSPRTVLVATNAPKRFTTRMVDMTYMKSALCLPSSLATMKIIRAAVCLLLLRMSITISSAMVGTHSVFLRVDYSDPTAGVILSYANGDYYWAGYIYYFTMFAFRCSSNTKIPEYADVTRYGLSGFMVYMDSIYACPSGTCASTYSHV